MVITCIFENLILEKIYKYTLFFEYIISSFWEGIYSCFSMLVPDTKYITQFFNYLIIHLFTKLECSNKSPYKWKFR